MQFSSLDISFSHAYGVVNGMYIATIFFLALFMLSYFWAGKEKSVATSLCLSMFMLIFFGLYNLYFQQLHGALSAYSIPKALINIAKYGAPLGMMTATYLVVRYMRAKSLKSYRLLNRLKYSIYALYATYFVSLVLLFFTDDIRQGNIIISLSLIPCLLVALYFYAISMKGITRVFFMSVFMFYLFNSILFPWLIYQHSFNWSSESFLLLHIILSIITLGIGFTIIRFGYQNAHHYGQVRAIDPQNLVHEIYSGIENDEFYLVYQPKKHLVTQKICGTEALIRWNHPKHGLIPPDRFITIAEKTDQINTITRWVIKTVTARAKAQVDAGYLIPISMNFSVINFQKDIVDYLLKQLKKYDLPANSIVIEITESLMLELNDDVYLALQTLHDAGVAVSLDDYGAGFSSLSYLRKLKVSELKIDRHFIFNLTESADNQAIVESTIQMARKMGIQVVAEGVEHDEVADLLEKNNCDVIQGYLLSKPLETRELDTWITQQNTVRC